MKQPDTFVKPVYQVFDWSLKRSGKSFNRNVNPSVFNYLLASGRRNFRRDTVI